MKCQKCGETDDKFFIELLSYNGIFKYVCGICNGNYKKKQKVYTKPIITEPTTTNEPDIKESYIPNTTIEPETATTEGNIQKNKHIEPIVPLITHTTTICPKPIKKKQYKKKIYKHKCNCKKKIIKQPIPVLYDMNKNNKIIYNVDFYVNY